MRLPASASVWTSLSIRGAAGSLRAALRARPVGFRYSSSAPAASTSTDTRQSLFTPTTGPDGVVKPFYITTPIFYVNACMSYLAWIPGILDS